MSEPEVSPEPTDAYVHAWINPPRDGSDVWCGSKARVKDVTAKVAEVTCPECDKALYE